MDRPNATNLPGPPRRWLYGAGFREFLDAGPDHILGELVRHTSADVDHNQTNAWLEQIRLLKALEL